MANIFDDIRPVVGNNTRNGFFPCIEATYKVRIEQSKIKPPTDNSGEAFIVELEVLESSTSDVTVGEFKDWYRGLDVTNKIQRKMMQKDLATFLCAAAGFDPDKSEERAEFDAKYPDLNKLVKEAGDNSLESRELCLRTYPKKTKAGSDFTVHCWSPGGERFQRVPYSAAVLDTSLPAPDPRAGWERSPDGYYAFDPSKQEWVEA